jgi:hypothetical protein
VVEDDNPEALELGVIDDAPDVDGFAGVANPGADGQCNVICEQ